MKISDITKMNNVSITKPPIWLDDLKKIYDEMDHIMLFAETEYCQPCKYEIPIKDKTLEVMERDFALKYPTVYKCFVEEQNRRMMQFIIDYSKNHEGTV